MKIVLIGYMASGKSAVGKKLASILKYDFIDLDSYIEKKENKTVSEIFSQNGEIYFRLKETECLKELLNSDLDFVLSLGGGTPCYSNNIKTIFEKSESFYLKASINTLFQRLSNEKDHRPLVAELDSDKLKEFIAKHLFERAPYYEQASNSIITDGKEVTEVVDQIKKRLI
ncbi:shikimate kinase [Urechidicola croceus]|uniref:Shikimate kinase n=1 Tax=Urechidicola croceus TaxID=1850246 RepID=A0A1D8P5Q2_9FLAO|nr:shikimate kinase [Urechidicola croceus]AOW19871.1 shikimate kinase [Urechidicola croceus]